MARRYTYSKTRKYFFQSHRFFENEKNCFQARIRLLSLIFMSSILLFLMKPFECFAEGDGFNKPSVSLQTQYERALVLCEKTFGAEHPFCSVNINNLAALFIKEGEYVKAKPLLERSLRINEKAYGPDSPIVSLSLNNLANLLQNQGNYAEAKLLYERSLKISVKTLGDVHPSTAKCMNNLATLLQSQGDFAGAKPLLERALKIHENALGPDHPDTASSLSNLASLHESQGDYSGAKPLYERALKIREKTLGPDHPDTATSLNNLACFLDVQGDYARAKQLYESALKIRERALGPDHPETANSLNNLSCLLKAQGDYAKAKQLADRALKIYENKLGSAHPDTALILRNIGDLLLLQGDYTGSRIHYERALKISEKALGPDHSSVAKCLNNIARLLDAQGDYVAEKPLFERALKINEKALGQNHPDVASSLNNLAYVLHAEGDYERAKPLYERSLLINVKALGTDHPSTAIIMNNLAYVLTSQGDYKAAVSKFEKSLIIFEKTFGSDHPITAKSLNNLACILKFQGDYSRSKPIFEKSLKTMEKALGSTHPDLIMCVNNLATLLDDEGDLASANALYERSLRFQNEVAGQDQSRIAKLLINYALLKWKSGETIIAKKLLKNALSLSKKNVQLVFSVQSERQQLRKIMAFRDYLDAYNSLCIETLDEKDSIYPNVVDTKSSVFSRQRIIHEFRIIARKSGDPKVERLFQDLDDTSRNLANLALHVPKPERKVAWESQIAELTQKKEEIEEELSRRSDEFRKLKKRGEITADQIRAVLPADAALVDFLEYTRYVPPKGHKGRFDQSKHFLAFVIRPNHPTAMIDLGLSKPIDDAVKSWRERIEGRRNPVDGADDPSLVIRHLVWEPLVKELKGVQTILLSPDGSLNQIPFDALPGDDPKKYLIEERSIVLVPSPQMLPELLEKKSASAFDGKNEEFKPSLLLVGDVDFGSSPGVPTSDQLNRRSAARSSDPEAKLNFRSLPNTKDEIEHIERSFLDRFKKNALSLKLDREKATEDALRRYASEYRWIHLATHGFFAPESVKSALDSQPFGHFGTSMIQNLDSKSIDLFGGIGVVGFHPGLLSGVVLAGANRTPEYGHDDGILTATEVAGLDLSNSELVVLSACETGLGKTAGGEGLLGLQRAFQVAGARSVVAGLWSVDDKATQMLISRFYENLWGSDRVKKPMSKLDALREAKLWMMSGARTDEAKRDQKPVDDNRNRGLKLLDKDPIGRTSPYFWSAFVLSGDWR